jgi:hypothetical protein
MKKRRRLTLVATGALALTGIATVYVARRGAAQAPAGPAIIFYQGEEYTGRSVTVTGTVFDLPTEEDARGDVWNWNDEVRSVVVVSGTWRLYQHGRLNTKLDDTALTALDVRTKEQAGGWSTLVSATSQGPLRIPTTAAGGFWRDISSVELVSEANLPDWAMDFRR